MSYPGFWTASGNTHFDTKYCPLASILCTKHIRKNRRSRTKQTCICDTWSINNLSRRNLWRLVIIRKCKQVYNGVQFILQMFYWTLKGASQPTFFSFQSRPPFELHCTVLNLCPWSSQVNLCCDFLPAMASGCVFTALHSYWQSPATFTTK